jgi:hypothetical protein
MFRPGIGLILIMAAMCAGELVPALGGFLHAIEPVIAFLLYVSLGFIAASKIGDRPAESRALIISSLVVHFLLYSTPFVVGYYTFPAKIAKAMTKERGTEVSYAEAATSLKIILEKETGSSGIPGYAVYTERRSLSAANIKEYAARQFEDVDDLGPLLAALLNVILYTIPIGLKWLLTNTLEIVREPGYIGLVFWYLVALGFYIFGLIMGEG